MSTLEAHAKVVQALSDLQETLEVRRSTAEMVKDRKANEAKNAEELETLKSKRPEVKEQIMQLERQLNQDERSLKELYKELMQLSKQEIL